MTQPESPEPRPDSRSAATAEADPVAPEETPAVAEPEPWTPERVVEWNNYYDVYVMLGIMLLAFLVSANKITQSPIWTHLQVGRLIAAKMTPVLRDPFSYTETGKVWVNVPWLFDWSQAIVYKAAYDLSPGIANDTGATKARADQVAAGALVALNALIYMLTAFVLMNVRRGGPGRWWSACAVGLALGAVVGPGAVILGGIAATSGPATVGPGTWGVFLLALEVWLIHRAIDLGRRSAGFALIPLFLLWANVSETFLIGLMILAACALGRARPGPSEPKQGPEPFGLPVAFGVFGACVLACLVNPSLFRVFGAAADPFLGLFRSTDVPTADQLSFFGKVLRKQAGRVYPFILGFYLITVALGFFSFYWNRHRFSLSRFLMYTTAVVLWGALKRYAPEFAVIFATTLTLNGQEWYLARYGTAGRIGSGWSVWSIGGRAVTILAIFLCLAKVLLGGLPIVGFEPTEGEGQFGFGFDRDDFAFETADFLKTAGFQGNVLNTLKSEGDALVWRAYPDRKVFIDNRAHLYPPDLFQRHQNTLKALAIDNIDGWKPLLDEYKISAVMVPITSKFTYEALSQSVNWIPFHDNGAIALFGRADAPAADLAYFKANRLEPDAVAYRRDKPVPPTERPPTAVSWMDNVFRTREMAMPQPHDLAARHWLTVVNPGTGRESRPDPARCLLAAREARTALASKPDDPAAFRILATAYRDLLTQETALLAGLSLTPENEAKIAQIAPRPGLLPLRYRQLITSLNYAIQTTPPPRNPLARQDLRRVNIELFQLYLAANFLDLARDRLQAILDKSKIDSGFQAADRDQIARDLAELSRRVKEVEEQLNTMTTEQQTNPVQLARFAVAQGMPGLAIHELEEAERTATNPALVKPQLLDLYCDTGQPDKAAEILGGGTIDDPSFGAEPGIAALRHSRVYFLLGNDDYAGTLLTTYAIPRLQLDRALRVFDSSRYLLHGEGKIVTSNLLQLPSRVSQQAEWEFEAGMVLLEGGLPSKAAEHFTNALTLAPKIGTRPVIAYYLEKLGKPIPVESYQPSNEQPTKPEVKTP